VRGKRQKSRLELRALSHRALTFLKQELKLLLGRKFTLDTCRNASGVSLHGCESLWI
jgi:hypothetical protein